MTDLEITKRCAEAMGYQDKSVGESVGGIMCFDGKHHLIFNPLEDDAQAMALVKRFSLNINIDHYSGGEWGVDDGLPNSLVSFNKDLNRAICECAAKLTAK